MATGTLAAAAAAVTLGAAAPAAAHAFGQRYDLPVPLLLFLVGAAATVGFSFVVIGAFVRGGGRGGAYGRIDLLGYAVGRLLASPLLVFAVRLVAVALFLLVVAAGFAGEQHPMRNLAPVWVWIIGWVGMVYVSAFVGDAWTLINPWRTLFAWAEAVARRFGGSGLSLGLAYPVAWQAWPAVAGLLVFAWLELVFPEPALPANVAWMLVCYSAVTWAGMVAFGRERWLRTGEVFSVLFALLARFAPLEIRVTRAAVCERCGLGCLDHDKTCVNCAQCFALARADEREWSLRPFAVGLGRNETVSTSTMALVLLFLSVVLYDGLLATPVWQQWEAPILAALAVTGEFPRLIWRSVGLVGFWLVFLAAYLVTCRLMAGLVGNRLSTLETARLFALTLIPIAIAYHLAHYLTFFLIQGQYAIPLASDPFGFGWNLFGTAGYKPDIAVVGARFAWYLAVGAIVGGHVIAVYLAHARATAAIPDRRPALLSQYPLTALMVTFTVVSLTIVAEPIVQQAASAQAATASRAVIQVPADALLPEPGSGRFKPVGAGRKAAFALRYGAMASLNHDGTRTEAADILYPYAVAYRWGAKVGNAGGDGRRYDPEVGRRTALLRSQLAGVRLAGVDSASKTFRVGETKFVREMLLVDVYLNDASANPALAAVVAPPWSPVPWHVMALMDEAVAGGLAAFSEDEAKRRSVPWLDMVRDKALNEKLAALVDGFERQAFVPEPLKGMVAADAARARWRALKAYYLKHGHFLVSNGPYFIKDWSKEATELTVFRDMSYPLGVGSYNAYALPRRAFITGIDVGPDGIKVVAEVEAVETFGRDYKIIRRPLKDVQRAGQKGLRVDCLYIVLAADGQALLAGAGALKEDGGFAIELGGKLKAGDYRVLVTLYLNGNTVDPDIRTVSFRAGGGS